MLLVYEAATAMFFATTSPLKIQRGKWLILKTLYCRSTHATRRWSPAVTGRLKTNIPWLPPARAVREEALRGGGGGEGTEQY